VAASDPRAAEPRPSGADLPEDGALERLRAAFRTEIVPVLEEADETPLSPRAPSRPAAPAQSAGGNEDHPAPEPRAWSSNRPASRTAAHRPSPKAATTDRPAGGGFFDSVWPSGRSGKPAPQEPQERPRETKREAPRSSEPAKAAASEEELVPVAILKSGVVDGMAYTLYTNGSIEAELAQGVMRFNSIEELRAHLEKSA
jgi:hypothetical protein